MSNETQSINRRYFSIFNPPVYVPRAFSGIDRQPCPVSYTMLGIDDDSVFKKIAIVIFQESAKFPTTFYTNADEGRDILTNQILREAVPGVAMELVKVIFMSVLKEGISAADELELFYNPNTLADHGVPVKKNGKEISWLNRDIVVGQIQFYTDYINHRRPLQRGELEEIITTLGRTEKVIR